jgi:electron transfer flavoprotein beta subunit
MNIVVCVKQIPDPEAPQSFDSSNNLNRSGKLLLDKADEYGVEMALQLVDKAGGGEVTVVSWDRPRTLRDCATRSPWVRPKRSL